MNKKIFILSLTFLLIYPACLYSADTAGLEREALALRVELNRSENTDPFEREKILQKIIDTCKGTDEAVNAYWDLADLYLDAFPEEMRQEACEMLELCLKNYPDSSRASMIKCRLIDLYDEKDERREKLIEELKNDKTLPNILRITIK